MVGERDTVYAMPMSTIDGYGERGNFMRTIVTVGIRREGLPGVKEERDGLP